MKKYKFAGTQALTVTLAGNDERILIPGEVYDLPENNSYIRTLKAKGYLQEQKPAKRNTLK